MFFRKFFLIRKLFGDFGLALKSPSRLLSEAAQHNPSESVRRLNTFLFILVLITVSFMAFQAAQIKTKFSMSQFYPAAHPLVILEKKVQGLFAFNKETNVIVVMQTKDSTSWLLDKNYLRLKELSKKFTEDGQIAKVTDLSTLQGAQSSSEQIDVGLLFENKSTAERKRLAQSHPFVKPQLLNKTEDKALIVLQLNTNNMSAIKNYSDQLEKYFQKDFPDWKVRVGGLSVLQSEMAQILKEELVRSSFLGILFFIVGLYLVYKKPVSMLPVLLVLLFVNTFVLGALASLNIPLDVLTSTLPVLVSLGVISLVIHIQGHLNISKNIALTYKQLFWENLLAVAIAGLGFILLRASDSAMIKNYGTVVALSSLGSWFLTHLFYWPLSFIFKQTTFRPWLQSKAFWTMFSLRYQKSIIASSAVVFVLGFWGVFHLNWNSRVLDDLPEKKSARLTTELIDHDFGGTIEMNFVVALTEGTWLEAKSLNKLHQLIQKIQTVPGVGSVTAVTDLFRSLEPSTQKRWVAQTHQISDASFLFSMGSSNPLDQFLSPDRKSTLIKVRFQDLATQEMLMSLRKISSVSRDMFPKAFVWRAGFAEQFHFLNPAISKDLVYNFWQALLIASLILMLLFKSWRLAIVACLPNLIPPMALLAWVSFNDIPLKPSVAIIFSIAIGMAFTNTIYVLGRIVKIRKEKNLHSYVPLKRALLEEGNACLVATTLVLFGFFVFLFSQFGVNKMFGQYMILSVVAAFFGDMIFMPSFIKQFKKFVFPSLAFFVLISGFNSKSAFAATSLSANEILNKAQSFMMSKDDSAKVRMKIIEADGASKTREMLIRRKFAQGKNQTLVKVLSPIDQKGAGLLSVVEKESEQQWVYLPSSKQVRRFVSRNKQEGVMGSELSPQDLDFNTVKSAQARLVKTEKVGNSTVSLIEVASNSNETAYSKAHLWINMSNFTPFRMDYYDAKGQVVKRVEFLNYVKVNQVQRAQKVVIKNLKNRRATELLLTDLKVNSGLTEDQFTQRALSKD